MNDQYLLLSVINGKGTLIHIEGHYELKKGTHPILPVGFGEFELDEECGIIVSHS